ncbi:hypothetical protein [Streptomyces cinereospinus]|uniref:Uncharacterized protein n=1 Tax=Streptomyces cinereospinus TaxID=285561 RepID=A0ABV5N5K1_9ACTN
MTSYFAGTARALAAVLGAVRADGAPRGVRIAPAQATAAAPVVPTATGRLRALIGPIRRDQAPVATGGAVRSGIAGPCPDDAMEPRPAVLPGGTATGCHLYADAGGWSDADADRHTSVPITLTGTHSGLRRTTCF